VALPEAHFKKVLQTGLIAWETGEKLLNGLWLRVHGVFFTPFVLRMSRG
jgi:hypothetical protein